MKKTVSLFVTFCIILLLLCSCSEREAVKINAAEAEPLQLVIAGALEIDSVKWRSAFLPAYDAAVEAQELELGTCSDYNQYISDRLAEAAEVREANYGKNAAIEISDITVKYIEMEDRPDLFAEYKDIFTLRYRLDLDSIEKVAEITGTLNIWGDSRETSDKAVYVTVQYDGKWYLHPVFYNLMY